MSSPTFAELGLPSELVEVLERKLITEPFEIQTLTIPDALVGRDILGRAPTGSGKTLAFGLPMLARLERGSKKLPRALVLSPTRELAEQISRELEPLAKAMDRSVLSVYGGVGLDRQIKALRKGVDVLVACPGRLLDLINQRAVRLDEVDIVVVDEADRMADMGFLPDVRKLLDQTSQDRQTLLFSATLDKDVQVLIDKYQHDPVVHEVGEVEPDLSIVDHRFIKVKKTDRVWLAADLIDDAGPTVIFVRTRHGVDRLARQLKAEGIKAGYIHGGRSQSQRDRALSVFIAGKVDALVATDVAARGIHVDGVACVIHFDPPADIKDYVHRSGRTARAGAEGMVVSFVDGPQVKESQKMQRRLALDAEVESPPARKPRSSRPASFDDRELDTPTRTRSKRNGNGAGRSGGSNRSKPASSQRRSGGGTTSTSSAGRRSGGGSESQPRRSGGGSAGSASKSTGDRRRSSSSSSSGSSSSSSSSSGSASARSEVSSPRSRSNGAKPATRSANGKPQGRVGAKPGAGKSSSARSKPGERRQETSPQRSGGSRSAGPGRSGSGSGGGSKPSSRSRNGRPVMAKGDAAKPKSKRSGKPRPKNRKNTPKATGRK